MEDTIKCDSVCTWNGGYHGCQILQGPRMVGGLCIYNEKNNKEVKDDSRKVTGQIRRHNN